MMATTTHPALAAHNAGKSRPFSSGHDWQAYVVNVSGIPYIVTVWADGSIGVQSA